MIHLDKRSYQTELRLAEDKRNITGTAIVYNSESVDLGGFREIVAPGALTKTLRDNAVKLLFNHDSSFVLGSVSAGTLKLTDTATGLDFHCDPPETTWANDLLVSIRRGDIGQCSFGFEVKQDSWAKVDGVMVRTLLDIAVSEISIVAFPAYTSTSVSVRSKEQFKSYTDQLEAINVDDQQTPADTTQRSQQKLTYMRRCLDLLSKGQ